MEPGPGSVLWRLTLRPAGKQKPDPSLQPCLHLLLSLLTPQTSSVRWAGESHSHTWDNGADQRIKSPAPCPPGGGGFLQGPGGPDHQKHSLWSWGSACGEDRRGPSRYRHARLSVLTIAIHVNMQPLKLNKKQTNYKGYLPSHINHGPWGVYARTPDFGS